MIIRLLVAVSLVFCTPSRALAVSSEYAEHIRALLQEASALPLRERVAAVTWLSAPLARIDPKEQRAYLKAALDSLGPSENHDYGIWETHGAFCQSLATIDSGLALTCVQRMKPPRPGTTWDLRVRPARTVAAQLWSAGREDECLGLLDLVSSTADEYPYEMLTDLLRRMPVGDPRGHPFVIAAIRKGKDKPTIDFLQFLKRNEGLLERGLVREATERMLPEWERHEEGVNQTGVLARYGAESLSFRGDKRIGLLILFDLLGGSGTATGRDLAQRNPWLNKTGTGELGEVFRDETASAGETVAEEARFERSKQAARDAVEAFRRTGDDSRTTFLEELYPAHRAEVMLAFSQGATTAAARRWLHGAIQTIGAIKRRATELLPPEATLYPQALALSGRLLDRKETLSILDAYRDFGLAYYADESTNPQDSRKANLASPMLWPSLAVLRSWAH